MACAWNGLWARYARTAGILALNDAPCIHSAPSAVVEVPMSRPDKIVYTARTKGQAKSTQAVDVGSETLDDVPHTRTLAEREMVEAGKRVRDRLKRRIKEAGITPAQMTQRLGCGSRSSVHSFLSGERGTRLSWLAAAICAELHLHKHHALGLEEWQVDALDALCEIRDISEDELAQVIKGLNRTAAGLAAEHADNDGAPGSFDQSHPPRRQS